MPKRRLLITGSQGFVGRAVTARILSHHADRIERSSSSTHILHPAPTLHTRRRSSAPLALPRPMQSCIWQRLLHHGKPRRIRRTPGASM